MASKASHERLDYLFNHIALPPRLPQKNDTKLEIFEKALTESLLKWASLFRNGVGSKSAGLWDLIINTLFNCDFLHAGGKLNSSSLKTSFSQLALGQCLIIYVAQQNAGLLIYRSDSAEVIFEAYEASASSPNILASSGPLIWDFPTSAVTIPAETFGNPLFQNQLAVFLEQASVESIKQFASIAPKAGADAYESRDAVESSLITHMLMALLEANGRQIFPTKLRKRVRDDVCWNDSEKPWKRSPLWLAIRVGIQRLLYLQLGGEVGFIHYKFFVSYVLSQLCDEVQKCNSMQLESLGFLRTKLSRRVAKLENQRAQSPALVCQAFDEMFDNFAPHFRRILRAANEKLEFEWSTARLKSRKLVQPLPQQADQSSLVLALRNSGNFLRSILSEKLQAQAPANVHFESTNREVKFWGAMPENVFHHPGQKLDQYLSLADFEVWVERELPTFKTVLVPSDKQCLRLAEKIHRYQDAAVGSYAKNPEQSSIMLLTILELWVSLDEFTIKLIPLVKDYAPGLETDLLNVLQLPNLEDMRRLQKVEAYLAQRRKESERGLPSIFADPTWRCFAARYFDQSESMKTLHDEINRQGELARDMKEQEWLKKCAEHEDVVKKISEKTCLFTTHESNPFAKGHAESPCEKCYLQRIARRMRIQVHEFPLPSDLAHAKAVVFELQCPPAFAAWRDSTWKVLSELARPPQMPGRIPALMIQEYSQYQRWIKPSRSTLTLASKNKSFLDTHYASVGFPVELNQVNLPNGLKLGLFDRAKQIWTANQSQPPTFAPHCARDLPSASPFSSLTFIPGFAPGAGGLTPNEIIASQTKCSPSISIHEYMTVQDLRSGTCSRWIRLLRELGSSHINLSSDATVAFITELALEAGPRQGDQHLRLNHWVFGDENFCGRLTKEIRKRLLNIVVNWREAQCMEILITLMLRVYSLASAKAWQKEAAILLNEARDITLNWIRLLRPEIYNAVDAETSQRRSKDAFWAALLCRRTYMIEAEAMDSLLSPVALSSFIESSIALQDTSAGLSATQTAAHNALVRDLKMVHRIESKIRESITTFNDSIAEAINKVWPEPEGAPPRKFAKWQFQPSPNNRWVTSETVASPGTMQQRVDYNIIEGSFLVDGRPLGKLPEEYNKDEFFRYVFGDRAYLTYPSSMPGMIYMLACDFSRHQIHIGFRGRCQIIRARNSHTTMELIPPETFRSRQTDGVPDLPVPLIDNCAHWLNLQNGMIEIRPRSTMYRSKGSDWQLDLHTSEAKRRESFLVDPCSNSFEQIARIIAPFEFRRYMIVFQPRYPKPISVHLPRNEVTFAVNRNGLLESRQLRAMIDTNQDIGTFYGLENKLVLKDSTNYRNRSVLVPMGCPTIKRHFNHVTAFVEPVGNFCKFAVNYELNRLDCPVEPRFIYLKALFHASTSGILADPLTGRTGVEEALACLKSGYSQPWTPLDSKTCEVLSAIANFTPHREYYPPELRSMQKVSWNPELTAVAQHDDYYPIIKDICQQSDLLRTFHPHLMKPDPLMSKGEGHLLDRARARNHSFHRADLIADPSVVASSATYSAKYRESNSLKRTNVLQAATLLKEWPRKLPVLQDLVGILQGWENIQGFCQPFDKVLLHDILNLDFATNWGSLFCYCRQSSGVKDRYRLMFFFSYLSFNNTVDMGVVRTLIGFSVIEDFKHLIPPEWPVYTHFRDGEVPTVGMLTDLLDPCRITYPGDERTTFQFSLAPKMRRKLELQESTYLKKSGDDCKELADYFLGQWPCLEPNLVGFCNPVLLDLEKALEVIRPLWLQLYQNVDLSRHIRQVQALLDRHRSDRKFDFISNVDKAQHVFFLRATDGNIPNLGDLLRPSGRQKYNPANPAMNSGSAPDQNLALSTRWDFHITSDSNVPRQTDMGRSSLVNHGEVSTDILNLSTIISRFVASENPVKKKYGYDLQQSLEAFQVFKLKAETAEVTPNQEELNVAVTQIKSDIQRHLADLRTALSHDCRYDWLMFGDLWPRIVPTTLLPCLSSNAKATVGPCIRSALIEYALSITVQQRLMRIEAATRRRDMSQLADEMSNPGHKYWQPNEYPDWLLLEIESNILLRPDQIDVALCTISPASGKNSVLQMMMGQGKSSCIIPMVAATLADSRKLLRVIVPKPLLLQMAQVLQARLGGLLGRPIKHVPFSRRTSSQPETINFFYRLHKDCLDSRGVILALPEHLLSFKLSGLQRILDEKVIEAKSMLKIQSWLSKTCRDVLDECDVSLAVKTQLIYPSGSQSMVDGHPNRWKTTQAVLHLAKSHIFRLQKSFRGAVEVVSRHRDGFPGVCFLRKEAEDALILSISDSICNGYGSILPVEDCSRQELCAIFEFIQNPKSSKKECLKVLGLFHDKVAVKQDILLLRGLLVHRILLLALNKRWNVQYGLHRERDPIAVPFHAKGVPSEQAEWGHPDVAILLTCISFYYSGLELPQLQQSLEQVLRSDNPSSEYDRLMESAKSIPNSLRSWNAINLDDEFQTQELWRHLRYSMVVIDYYLNNFVFPRHAKQFQRKLQASGWDIPLFSTSSAHVVSRTDGPPAQKFGEAKSSPKNSLTTGFSGTNDNRTMLPLSIHQADLAGLSHTNAEVLTYLLQPRNRNYVKCATMQGKRLSERDFLRILSERKIRMLIDAGAQILEMTNLELVQAWLLEDTQAPAAVYFDKFDKPWVTHRDGRLQPLFASPFADNLGECLVYLDEAHTRGTDLKMPTWTVGALTLGPGQTKDHTVQAAMRLRQLRTTQSVVFFAPPEVHQSICDINKKTINAAIDSGDVVLWLLEQTCRGIEQLQPLYISQGSDFCRRTEAAMSNPDHLTDPGQRRTYIKTLEQQEHHSLEQLYAPKTISKSTSSPKPNACPEISAFVSELQDLRSNFRDTGNAVAGSALQEVEQEREVQIEVETVRELQKPSHAIPLPHLPLHRDILAFVNTGWLTMGSPAYEQVFSTFRRTALGAKFGIHETATCSKTYVSADFSNTVVLPHGKPDDAYQRPVQWILWGFLCETALIISPAEAEQLLPLVRGCHPACTHLVVYSAPVTRKMLHFDDLQYYSVPALPPNWRAPSWLVHDLGIFSGRLYFRFEEYEALCDYLGLRSRAQAGYFSKDGHERELLDIGKGGAKNNDPSSDQEKPPQDPFTDRPLMFMQEWLTIRRRGQDFALTPMGYICQGKRLAEDGSFLIEKTAGEETEDQNGSDTDAMSVVEEERQRLVGGVGGSHMELDESPCEYDDMDVGV